MGGAVGATANATGGAATNELVSVASAERVRSQLLRMVLTFALGVCREQDELIRQLEVSVSERERKELQRAQERLLLKMERKGEQISKLYKHKTQAGVRFTHNRPASARLFFCDSSPLPFLLLDKEVTKGGQM